MDADLAHAALSIAKAVQSTSDRSTPLPSEVLAPTDQAILPHSMFRNTRGYIEKVVFQVNATYTATCYDACAVMIRRLIEMLIIEAYEHKKRGSEVKDSDGNYYMLEGLTTAMLDGSWTLSRTTKSQLKKLKQFGDLSAHSRRYNAQRQYVDDVVIHLRVVVEELLYLSGLRK
jgi:hypothetical protein